MAKPNAKTLQERMGFTDSDLKTPGHDAIMMWLDEVVETRLTEWLGVERWEPDEEALAQEMPKAWGKYVQECHSAVEHATHQLTEAEKDLQRTAIAGVDMELLKRRDERRVEECRQNLVTAQSCDEQARLPRDFSPIPQRPGVKVVKKTWEQPVTTGKDYTVGFVDMAVEFRRPSLSLDSAPGLKWKIGWYSSYAYFEVKTAIPSLGELLRQLTHYRQHLYESWSFARALIFVVCPDTRFADKIREQGFGFIQSPGAMPKTNGQAKDDGWIFGRGN